MSGYCFGKKYFVKNFAAEKIGIKRGLSAGQRAKIVSSHEERYLERKISEKLKLCKAAIHHAIVRFRKFAGLQKLHRAGRCILTSPRDDYMTRRMVVHSSISSSKSI